LNSSCPDLLFIEIVGISTITYKDYAYRTLPGFEELVIDEIPGLAGIN